MDVWNLRNYVRDIKVLQSLISRYNIEGRFEVLENVVESLEKKTFVDYDLSDMEFWIDATFKGTLPKSDTYSFTVVSCDNKVALTDPIIEDQDSIYIYSLDLKISLFKSKRSDRNDALQSSWHLDRELHLDRCRLSHPYYHFQFGGKKLEYLSPGMGLLSSPRLPHPPMDIILLFHFIINNFYDNIKFVFVKQLFEDPDYINIIKNSRKRIWDDYFKSFSGTTSHLHYTFDRTFPLYIN